MKDTKELDRQEYKTLKLDVDYYQSFLDDIDIPKEQKHEFLETLWNIMVQFVDMGFGIEATQLAISNKPEFNLLGANAVPPQNQETQEIEPCN